MRYQPKLAPTVETYCRSSERHTDSWIEGVLDAGAILGLLFLLLFVSTSHAQQAEKADISDLSIEQLLDVKILTASKFAQSASDAPSSVTVITRDDIHKYGYRTLADVLQSVRGFYVTYDRNYSYVGIRGFQRPGDYNSRILLLIDGHRLNDNIYAQGYMGNEFPLDLDLVERIEIVRSATSSLYGTSAFFGVVNVITRKANEVAGAEVSFEPASFGSYKGRATYGGEHKGAELVLSGSFYGAAGQDLFFPEFDSPATHNGIAQNEDGEAYQDFLATLKFHGFTFEGVYGMRDKGIPTAAYETVFNAHPGSDTEDSHRFGGVQYERAIRKWEMTASTSLSRHVYNGTYIYQSALDPQSVDVNKDLGWGTWWDTELKLQRKFNRHNLTFGTELQENIQADQVNYDTVPPAFGVWSLPPSSSEWSLYAQDELSLTRKVSFSAGARFDHYVEFGGTTNPRLAFIYHFSDPTTLKFLYGTAFRAPTPYEMFYYSGAYEANLKLQPESMKTVEVVVEHRLGKMFLITGDVFRNDVDGLITQQTNPDGSIQYSNSQNIASTGLEAEISGRLSTGMQLSASYAYAPGRDEITNQELTNSAHNLTKLNLAIPIAHNSMSLSADAQYTGARKTLAGNSVGAFPMFNVTLLSHQLSHVDVSASVYNLLNRSHWDPALPDYPMDRIQQDGRSLRVKLTWHSQIDSH